MAQNTEFLQRLGKLVPRTVNSISAQVVNACAGLTAMLYVLGSKDVDLQPLAVLGFSIAVTCITAAVIAVTAKGLHSTPLSRFLCVLLAGAIRGSLICILLALNLTTVTGPQYIAQLIGSVAYTTIWILIAANVVEGTQKFRTTFSACFESAVWATSQQPLNSRAWVQAHEASQREQELARARVTALSLPDAGITDPSTARDLNEIAQEIHAAATERIRPMSHQMWAEGSVKPPRLPVSDVAIRTLSTWPSEFKWTLPASFGIVYFGVSISAGPWVALFVAMVVSLVLLTGFTTRNRILNSTRISDSMAGLALVGIGPATYLLLEVLGSNIGLPPNSGGSLIVALFAFSLAVLSTALFGIRRRQDVITTELQRLLENGYWERQVNATVESRHANDAATFLHHKVQSQLLAVALQLELAAASPNSLDAAETLNKVRTILGNRPDGQPEHVDGFESIIGICQEWAGICAITTELPDQHELHNQSWSLLDMMIRELVANAVRSAKARNFHLSAELTNTHSIHLIVTDDGTFTTTTGRGLGKEWMDAVAQDVNFTPTPTGGTQITMRIPKITQI